MLYSHHCLISTSVSKCCADHDTMMKRIIIIACRHVTRKENGWMKVQTTHLIISWCRYWYLLTSVLPLYNVCTPDEESFYSRVDDSLALAPPLPGRMEGTQAAAASFHQDASTHIKPSHIYPGSIYWQPCNPASLATLGHFALSACWGRVAHGFGKQTHLHFGTRQLLT